MATARAATGAKATAAKAEPKVQVNAPSRREFLFYIWGASMVMLLGETTAAVIWFIFPRFKEGEFGGVFTFDPADVPAPDSAPFSVAEGRFHVSQTKDNALVTLYGVCTHLGCLPKWVPTNHRFECPCHGSKYELDGTYIEGPAPRSLDRFQTTITFANGDVESMDALGDPIPLNGREIVSIAINTGSRILRPGRV